MRHNEKVAVVTGAANGIGLATAKRLHAEGAKVILADVETETAEREARSLDPSGRTAKAIKCDVASRADVVAAITLAVLRHRIAINFTAQSEGITADDVVRKILEQVPQTEPLG